MGKLVAEISEDDRIGMVTKYTAQFADDPKAPKPNASEAHDKPELNGNNLKTTVIIAIDAREKAEHNQTIGDRLSELERSFKRMPQTNYAAPAPAAPCARAADGTNPDAAPVDAKRIPMFRHNQHLTLVLDMQIHCICHVDSQPLGSSNLPCRRRTFRSMGGVGQDALPAFNSRHVKRRPGD